MIFVAIDERNDFIRKPMIPWIIGFTVASLISLFAPLTQAGWNPARDFGPRIVAALAGYGRIAIPGPRNGFWIYIVGPMIGAPIGGAIRDIFLEPACAIHPSNAVTLYRRPTQVDKDRP